MIQLEVRIPEAARRTFWIKVDPDGVDLCMVDPVRPVDAVVDADLRSLTRVWMGDLDFDTAVSGGEIVVLGPAALTRRIPAWFGRHPVLGAIGPADRT